MGKIEEISQKFWVSAGNGREGVCPCVVCITFFSDQSHENLRLFLNAEEALDDIAYFIEEMNKRNNYTNPMWITFGGSYAGILLR